MNILEFSDSELLEMRSVLVIQLEQAIKKVQDLQNIIDRIDKKNTFPTFPNIKQEKKIGKTEFPIGSKKLKLSNNDYSKLIMETLKEKNKPFNAYDLTTIALNTFNIDKGNRETIRLGIARACYVFEKNEFLKSYLPKGKGRGKHFGLPEWFEGSKLKKEYLAQIKKNSRSEFKEI